MGEPLKKTTGAPTDIPAAPPADKKPAEAPKVDAAKAPAPESKDEYSPRGTVFLEAGYQFSGMGLSNTNEGAHTGHGFNGSLGWMYPVQRRWLDLGLKFNVSHGGLSTSLGEGAGDSKISATTWGIGPSLRFNAIPRWLSFDTSLLFGSKHLSSDGTVFSDNPMLVKFDDSESDSDLKSGTGAFNLIFSFCAGVPGLVDGPVRLGLKACYERSQSGHDVKINYASGQDAPAIGVDTAENKFLALLTFEIPTSKSDRREQRYADYYANKAAEEKADAEKTKKPESPAKAPEAPKDTKPAVKVIYDQAVGISADVNKALGSKRGEVATTLSAGVDPKANSNDKKSESFEKAKAVVGLYKASKADYEAAKGKLDLAKADLEKDPVKAMSADEKKVAVEALAVAEADVKKLEAEMNSLKDLSATALKNLYSIRGLGKEGNAFATQAAKELGIKLTAPKADGAKTVAMNADGTCPEGYPVKDTTKKTCSK